jgi:uncharacterized protein (TIGR02246 family)
MRVTWICGLLFAIFCRLTAAQGTLSGTDSKALRAVVAEYMRARNDKDAEAVRRLFTKDADQLVSNGEWRKGLEALIQGTSASSQKEASKSTITVEDMRLLDEQVAIVDGRYQTTSLGGQVRNMWTTLVMRRTAEGWRIAAIRNMLPSQPAGAAH